MIQRSLLLVLLVLISAHLTGAQPRPLPDESYPQDPNPGPPPSRGTEVPYSLGVGDSERFGSKTTDFYPRTDLNRVVRLRLTGLNNTVEIKQVRVFFADYREERSELSLQGELKPGYVKGTLYGGRPIYRIEVTASSSYLWKKPGQFRVDITAVK